MKKLPPVEYKGEAWEAYQEGLQEADWFFSRQVGAGEEVRSAIKKFRAYYVPLITKAPAAPEQTENGK